MSNVSEAYNEMMQGDTRELGSPKYQSVLLVPWPLLTERFF